LLSFLPSESGGLQEVLDIRNDRADESFALGFPKADDWDEGRHLAYFMNNVVHQNKTHTDGLFKHRSVRNREADMLIWGALKAVQHAHAPS
jgi:hypothetical protein